jgi:hypothetical protein
MADRRFLYVFAGPRAPQFAIYHIDPPSPAMLKQQPAVIFHDEIAPDESGTLDELAEEFYRRAREGEITMKVNTPDRGTP